MVPGHVFPVMPPTVTSNGRGSPEREASTTGGIVGGNSA
eukprot:CAMPEP_0174290366 /NCGR_PEP_ID=MMETSP0809-20121228/28578_1 /TAXON_ID=73025 ORGANISM="Eutreptiella gymnastica-like, Strain CCMP1594" /NCGR_SAMPLE_ID=MMETSP0809 /ASSEMBLY_ACC=CAM_ASM_000658 /LENGTH=38 /DNA_ID= /DNA_START= /DNA_END= /DNA_ORIENTATION=